MSYRGSRCGPLQLLLLAWRTASIGPSTNEGHNGAQRHGRDAHSHTCSIKGTVRDDAKLFNVATAAANAFNAGMLSPSAPRLSVFSNPFTTVATFCKRVRRSMSTHAAAAPVEAALHQAARRTHLHNAAQEHSQVARLNHHHVAENRGPLPLWGFHSVDHNELRVHVERVLNAETRCVSTRARHMTSALTPRDVATTPEYRE